MIIKNAIRCNLCGDEIESKHRHDYVQCKCGACAVDGGHDYLHRSFSKIADYTDLSITQPDYSPESEPPKDLQANKTPDSTYQIGGATYLVLRDFGTEHSLSELIAQRVVHEHEAKKQASTDE